MNSVFEAFRIVFLFFLVRSAVKMFIHMRLQKVMNKKEKQSEQTVKNKEEPVMVDWVQDEICGKDVPKSKAYIVVKDDKKHYFCSWACREKFLHGQSSEA